MWPAPRLYTSTSHVGLQLLPEGIFNADEATIDNAAKHILADKNYRRHIVEEVSDLKLFAVVRENVTLNVEEVSLDDYRAYMAQHQSQAAEEAAEESAE